MDRESFFSGLQEAGDIQRVYAIGDSHTLPFSGRFYSHPALNKSLQVVSKYIPGFRSKSAMNNGKIDQRLLNVLLLENLLARGGTAAHLALDKQTFNTAFVARDPLSPPIIIIFSGEIDLRAHIIKKIGDEFDIDIPGMESDVNKESIPQEDVLRMAVDIFSPLLTCISHLREMGLDRIFVHCLPEPSLNDEKFVQVNGYLAPWLTRHKCTHLCNHVLRQLCRKNTVPYIDIADQIIDEGKLDPRYELDGCHLAPPAYAHSLQEFLRLNFSSDPPKHNASRWALFSRIAAKKSLSAECSREKIGFCQLDHEAFSAANKLTGPVSAANNDLPNLDWVSSLHTPAVSTAEPTVDLLKELYKQIFNGPNCELLEDYLGFYFQVVNCRVREIELKKDMHFSPCSQKLFPSEVCYGVMIINSGQDGATGAGRVKLEFTSSLSSVGSLDANPGAIYLSKGNLPKLQFKAVEAQRLTFIDFFFMPRIPDEPKRINWASENCWPIDPFHFSVMRMKAEPAWASNTESHNPSFLDLPVEVVE